ncbi:MAG: hypothetical protein HXX11_20965 [Desulfuromonadales bacterium]|nr:hypothetical protein [Desulfuromonadales bacterium]
MKSPIYVSNLPYPHRLHRDRAENDLIRKKGNRVVWSPESQSVEKRQIVLVGGDRQTCCFSERRIIGQSVYIPSEDEPSRQGIEL